MVGWGRVGCFVLVGSVSAAALVSCARGPVEAATPVLTATATGAPFAVGVLRQTFTGQGGTGTSLSSPTTDPAVAATRALATVAADPTFSFVVGKYTPDVFLADLAEPGPADLTSKEPVLGPKHLVWVVRYSGLPSLNPHNNAGHAVGTTPAPVVTYTGHDCEYIGYVDALTGKMYRTDDGCPGSLAGLRVN